MCKRTLLVMLLLIVMLGFSAPVSAGYFDFALLSTRHSVDVNIDIEGFDLVVLIKAQGNRGVVPLDSKGDMKSIGDFELEETKRSYSEVRIGYKLGPITPFVGYGTQGISKTERTVAINEITGKNEVVTKNTKDTNSGVIFGVSFDARIGGLGILATLAKASSGFYGETNVKYHISDNLALVGGYLYHPSVNANGVMLGLGVSY